MKEPPDNLAKSGMKFYSKALLISKIGCLSSILLVLLGIVTIFFEKGDTSPSFDLLVVLAIVVPVICGAGAIFTSLVGITNGIITVIEDKKYSEEIRDAITKNISLLLGVILVLLFLYRFLRNYIW